MAGETQWSKADRAAVALQAYVEERQGPGASYGDEGSEEWAAAVADLLLDLKHLLFLVDGSMMLTDMAEEAVNRWDADIEILPVGGDEDDGTP